jgi:aspartate kinase
MKFGGTSVGDASCIARTAQICAEAARDGSVVVVVSAMGGVTNRLIEAANFAEAGDGDKSSEHLAAIRKRHEIALGALIADAATRKTLAQRMEEILDAAARLCEGTALLRELTPRTLDMISSLGERLSAPMVAAAISALGTSSEPIEATELIVTDGFY